MRVDGTLLCDAETPRTLGDLCGTAVLEPAAELFPGDNLDSGLVCTQATPIAGGLGWGRMTPSELQLLHQPVDVNSASAAELSSLQGIGPTLAGRIVAGRPFAAIGELIRVRGIGPKTIAAIADRARARRSGSGLRAEGGPATASDR